MTADADNAIVREGTAEACRCDRLPSGDPSPVRPPLPPFRFFRLVSVGSRFEVVAAHLPLAVLTGGALLAAALLPLFTSFLPGCNFLRLTGYPCPFCGFTRAFHAVITGEWQTAVIDCPLGAATVVLVAAVFLWHASALVSGKRLVRGRWLRLTGFRRPLFWGLVTVLVLTNWLYRLAHGLQ
jgi:hypothetical protein